MNNVWLITLFTVIAMFGAITVLPILNKTTQTRNSSWSTRFWNIETLRTAGNAPLIFTLISANILAGWAWGSAVSWLLITLIFGLLMLPLTNGRVERCDYHRPSNNWKHNISLCCFLIASLSILTRIIIGLVIDYPEVGSAILLFIILMVFNRYAGTAALGLFAIGIASLTMVSTRITFVAEAEDPILKILLSSFMLASLFALIPNRPSRTTLSIFSGLGTLLLALTFIITGLTYSGALVTTLNTPNEPALPLICFVLLLIGLSPGGGRPGSSKASFSTIGAVLSNRHLYVFTISMVVVIAVISMSDSFTSLLATAAPTQVAEEVTANVAVSSSIYSISFAPEVILKDMLDHLFGALPINDEQIPILQYVIIFCLALSTFQLALKQLESVVKIVNSQVFANEQTSTNTRPVAVATPWVISAAIIATILFAPNLALWLSCSASFAILLIRKFCVQSLKLPESGAATRIYLSISLVLILILLLQLSYLALNSGLKDQFSITALAFMFLILHILQTAPLLPVLANKLKKTGGSALEELNNL